MKSKHPIIIYKGQPKKHSWIRWMCVKVKRKNDNNLFSIVGKTGSGKTWAGIYCGEMLSKKTKAEFGIDNIVFSLRELMELLNSGKLKRGSTIVFDEPQISISAKTFQSEANKVFTMLVSTFRHLNLTLLFCTPYENLLDKSTRKLFHGTFTTQSINKKTQSCRVFPRIVEYGGESDKKYIKRMIISFLDKSNIRRREFLQYWDIPRPSQELIDVYEVKKKEFTTNLNKNILKKLIAFDETGKSMTAPYKEQEDTRKPLTEKQERAKKVLSSIEDSNKMEQASKQLGISIQSVHNHRKLSIKKGYTEKEFKI